MTDQEKLAGDMIAAYAKKSGLNPNDPGGGLAQWGGGWYTYAAEGAFRDAPIGETLRDHLLALARLVS